ncbi:MAG: alanine/ornithine racemase family PLP-dependent enzyme [Microthrixaceae bacterium]
MSGLRLDVDLDKIAANARELVTRFAARGISITGVTKAMLGPPALARALLDSGVAMVADSRMDSVERMRDDGIDAPILLLRSPAPSEIERVIRSGVTSANTELGVLTLLGSAARTVGRVHDVMVMVELGDLREGVLPTDLDETVRHVLGLPSLRLTGLGTNLACRSGVAPSDDNMGQLSSLVDAVEARFGIEISTVSGGNSANVTWALDTAETGRINDLRLGEAILLGREPLQRQPILGLHTDAVSLVAEVIESKRKPTRPWGQLGQNAFGLTASLDASVVEDRGEIWQTILAVGRNDTEPDDLQPPAGVEILAASSDHLITETGERMQPGDAIRFSPGYAALLRSMTSPFVAKEFSG